MQTHSVLLRIVALFLLLYSLSLFGSSLRKVRLGEERLSAFQSEFEQLSQLQSGLEESISALRRGEGMDVLARERLGLVMPEERIFYFTKEDAAS